MEYNQQVAGELQQRFKLSQLTLDKWRRANYIPDRYFTGNASDFKIQGLTMKEIRLKANMTLTGMAEDMQAKLQEKYPTIAISQQLVSAWETGRSSPYAIYKADVMAYLETILATTGYVGTNH